MSDTAVVFEELRQKVSDLVRGLSPEELERSVPATPGWTIRDIACHLSGDISSVIAGDFPSEFFQSFGDPRVLGPLNEWTGEHVASRKDLSVDEILDEWERNARVLVSMMRGTEEAPPTLPPFADRVLITDLAVHQHDIYGALGTKKDRDAPGVKIGAAGYIAMMGFRLANTDSPPLRVVAGDSERIAGDGEPGATVSADRFEMFRALSGRRSPEQIRAFEWHGDPEPYVTYFYPYGIRHEALVE